MPCGWSNSSVGCGSSAPAIRTVPLPSLNSPTVTLSKSAAPAFGSSVDEVATTSPPAFLKAAFSTCHWGAFDSSPPDSAFWIAKPSGVGSKVWRRFWASPPPKRDPGCLMLRASGLLVVSPFSSSAKATDPR